jgi:hypothetical protein
MDLLLFSELYPDPHSLKKLDSDPHKVNTDPKHGSEYGYPVAVPELFFKSPHVFISREA